MRRLLGGTLGRWRELLRTVMIVRLAGNGARPDALIDLLVRDAPDGCLVLDAAGRVLRTNAALLRLAAGVDLSPGSDAALLFEPISRSVIWQKVVQLLRGQSVEVRAERACLAAEGEVHVLVSADPVGDGAIDGVLIRFIDITPQARLEAQLVQSQKQQAVGQLAGGIAHDFNNLLTAIMGAADAIATRPGIDPDTLDEATQIQNGAERGAALVRQLLAFGRQQTLQPRALAVNETITALASLLRRLLGEAVRLELDLEQPGRVIRADPTQLDQVLINLAVNARDAMPDGGVLILRTGHLTLYRGRTTGSETIPPGRYVTVEVADTGTGIAADVLPRIFDPFFTTKREQGGNGLGLSTVQGIIRQSEGYLTVDSSPGQGTRFRLHFPRWDGAVDAPVATAPPSVLNAQSDGRVLLLVEDEEPVRRLAARSFERRGWTVLAAESGEAALSMVATTDGLIAAVVSDMVMPGMDGASLVRALRNRPGLSAVPAILVSGYAEETLRREIGTQSTIFVAKPYLPRDLVERVEAVVAGNVPNAV